MSEGFVTTLTAGQLFGIRLNRVRDVFVPLGLSRVPLAPPEIAGLINLRGRVVTAIDLRRRLGLPPRADAIPPVAVGIEERGELYGLIVDRVGDVLSLPPTSFEPNPPNLDAAWMQASLGVYRLRTELMIVLDIDKLLDLRRPRTAA